MYTLGPDLLENPYQMESENPPDANYSGGILGTLWISRLGESLPNGVWKHSGDTLGPDLLENPYQLESENPPGC